MKPSIGRIVLFHARFTDGFGKMTDLKAYPAIILDCKTAEVYKSESEAPEKHPGAAVDLQVFGWYNANRDTTSTKEVPFALEPKDGHWTWPPKVN